MEGVIRTKVVPLLSLQTSWRPLAGKTRRWTLRTVSGLPLYAERLVEVERGAVGSSFIT